MLPTLELRFPSELHKTRDIVKDIMLFLNENLPKLSADDSMDLRLIFSELLYNAVIHGNSCDARRNVHLTVLLRDDVVYSTVTDEGAGFDHCKFLAELMGKNDWTDERGRGILLVYHLADFMIFNSEGNQINFCKKVNAK